MSMRDELLAKTSGIRKTSSINDGEVKRTSRTQTAPGMAGALAVAQMRIQELESSGATSQIPVGEIVPNPWQPRRVFNEGKLSELAESIREVGLLQPIVVRRVDSSFQIVAGERRWRAHKMLDQATIRAVVADCSDADMAVLALVENVSRDDLTDYEVAASIRLTESEFPDRRRMAEALGMSRAGLYQFLSFEKLPDFVRRDLDLRPDLLGANAAQDIVAALKKHGNEALARAEELWVKVTAGELTQKEFVAALGSKAKEDTKGGPNERSIEKFFSGKAHAGSITRDSGGFTIKVRPGMLDESQEKELRDFMARCFSREPKGA